MSIVIGSPTIFAVETYSGLQDYIAEVLDRDDLTAKIPTFIHLAGLRLNRLLLPPARQGSYSVSTIAGTATAGLPADYQRLISVRIAGLPLDQETPVNFHARWGSSANAQPVGYSIENGVLRLGPTPDGVYTVLMTYMKDITPLSEINPSNWVLADHADLYIYGALLQAEAYLSNDARLALWKFAFEEAIDEVNKQGVRYMNSGSSLRLRSPVCI